MYGLGALITTVAGLRIARLLAIPLLACAGIYAGSASLLSGKVNLAFYRALAIEDAGVLLVAILLASWALNFGKRGGLAG